MNFVPQKYSATSCELFVGNLDENLTEDILFHRFHNFGKILQVKIYRHVITKKSLGYGFITYARPQEAQRAKANTNRVELLGKRLRVCLVEEYYNLNKSANLLIKGLAKGVKEVELEKECERFGPVFSTKVIEEDGEGAKAFVQFETLADAERCLSELKDIGGKPVIVEQATRKVFGVAKGRFGPGAQEALRAQLETSGPSSITSFEVDEGRSTFFATIKFETEEGLRAFLQDFATSPQKCLFIRPLDLRSRRNLPTQRTSQKFQKRRLALLPHCPCQP